MLIIILFLSLLPVSILVLGFLNVRIVSESRILKSYASRKKLNKHARKMIRKKLWYHRIHEGFIKLPGQV